MQQVVAEVGVDCVVPEEPFCNADETPYVHATNGKCQWCNHDWGPSSGSRVHQGLNPCTYASASANRLCPCSNSTGIGGDTAVYCGGDPTGKLKYQRTCGCSYPAGGSAVALTRAMLERNNQTELETATCIPLKEFANYREKIALPSLPKMVHVDRQCFEKGGTADSLVDLSHSRELVDLDIAAFKDFNGEIRMVGKYPKLTCGYDPIASNRICEQVATVFKGAPNPASRIEIQCAGERGVRFGYDSFKGFGGTHELSRETCGCADEDCDPPTNFNGDSWVLWNGSEYSYFPETQLKWAAARDVCLSFGADLVAFETAEEEDFVVRKVMGNDGGWTGCNDLDEEGTYVWSGTNKSCTAEGVYSNWRGGAGPTQSSNSNKDCATFVSDNERVRLYGTADASKGTWINDGCEGYKRFACERSFEASPISVTSSTRTTPEVITTSTTGTRTERVTTTSTGMCNGLFDPPYCNTLLPTLCLVDSMFADAARSDCPVLCDSCSMIPITCNGEPDPQQCDDAALCSASGTVGETARTACLVLCDTCTLVTNLSSTLSSVATSTTALPSTSQFVRANTTIATVTSTSASTAVESGKIAATSCKGVLDPTHCGTIDPELCLAQSSFGDAARSDCPVLCDSCITVHTAVTCNRQSDPVQCTDATLCSAPGAIGETARGACFALCDTCITPSKSPACSGLSDPDECSTWSEASCGVIKGGTNVTQVCRVLCNNCREVQESNSNRDDADRSGAGLVLVIGVIVGTLVICAIVLAVRRHRRRADLFRDSTTVHNAMYNEQYAEEQQHQVHNSEIEETYQVLGYDDPTETNSHDIHEDVHQLSDNNQGSYEDIKQPSDNTQGSYEDIKQPSDNTQGSDDNSMNSSQTMPSNNHYDAGVPGGAHPATANGPTEYMEVGIAYEQMDERTAYEQMDKSTAREETDVSTTYDGEMEARSNFNAPAAPAVVIHDDPGNRTGSNSATTPTTATTSFTAAVADNAHSASGIAAAIDVGPTDSSKVSFINIWADAKPTDGLYLTASVVGTTLSSSGVSKKELKGIWTQAKMPGKPLDRMDKEEFLRACDLVVKAGGFFEASNPNSAQATMAGNGGLQPELQPTSTRTIAEVGEDEFEC